jgi:hypothetical protein
MIPEPEGKNAVSEVVAVKEEPEGIDDALGFFNDYKNSWRRTSAPATRGLNWFG